MAKASAWVMIPKRYGKADEMVLDMHPLVLCKDCKHHGKGTCGAGAGIAFLTPNEWFCADVEREDAENN